MARRPPAVARVLQRATATARAHDMFPPGGRVLVGVSGGPDSVCLLETLHRLRRLLKLKLTAFHFDHRLHRASADHAAYVRRQAARLRVSLVVREAVDRPREGRSVEAWARLARYAAMSEVANEEGADRLAVAHTLDDQAETVLLGLVRGGGLESVAGIDPVSSVPPLGLTAVRPLLEVSRAEVEAFCRALGLRPRRDPTNRDDRFLRNRIRALLPDLEERLGRGLRATLARTAANVRADAALLDALASEAARSAVAIEEHEVRLDAAVIAALPEPVAARVVRQGLRVAAALGGGWDADVEAAHVRSLLDLAAGPPRRRADLPGALKAERAKGYVRLTREGEGSP